MHAIRYEGPTASRAGKHSAGLQGHQPLALKALDRRPSRLDALRGRSEPRAHYFTPGSYGVRHDDKGLCDDRHWCEATAQMEIALFGTIFLGSGLRWWWEGFVLLRDEASFVPDMPIAVPEACSMQRRLQACML